MKLLYILAALLSSLLLSSCGDGEGGIPPLISKEDVNVAAAENGGSASAAQNSAEAINLIDEDLATSWVNVGDSPILITFREQERIKQIALFRTASTIGTGNSPDILIELSADGNHYEASNLTLINGGLPCSDVVRTETELRCSMKELPVQYVRITVQNDKAFALTEFNAVAAKSKEHNNDQ